MLFAHLVSRILGLVALAVIPFACYLSYRVGQDYLARQRPCVSAPQGVAVHIAPRDVAYARAQGWPRVQYRGDPLGWAPALDRGPVARRVRERTARFCPGRRFRLVARRE